MLLLLFLVIYHWLLFFILLCLSHTLIKSHLAWFPLDWKELDLTVGVKQLDIMMRTTGLAYMLKAEHVDCVKAQSIRYLERAQRCFMDALRYSPNDPLLLSCSAECSSQHWRICPERTDLQAVARERFKQAVERDPSSLLIRSMFARFLGQRAADVEAEMEQLVEALMLNPNMVMILQRLATVVERRLPVSLVRALQGRAKTLGLLQGMSALQHDEWMKLLWRVRPQWLQALFPTLRRIMGWEEELEPAVLWEPQGFQGAVARTVASSAHAWTAVNEGVVAETMAAAMESSDTAAAAADSNVDQILTKLSAHYKIRIVVIMATQEMADADRPLKTEYGDGAGKTLCLVCFGPHHWDHIVAEVPVTNACCFTASYEDCPGFRAVLVSERPWTVGPLLMEARKVFGVVDAHRSYELASETGESIGESSRLALCGYRVVLRKQKF